MSVTKQQDLRKNLKLVELERQIKEEENQQLEKELQDRIGKKILILSNNHQLNDSDLLGLEQNK